MDPCVLNCYVVPTFLSSVLLDREQAAEYYEFQQFTESTLKQYNEFQQEQAVP